MIPLPADDAASAGERETLLGFLAYYRAVLARKADGLTDGEARAAPCPPSDLTLLGLVRHMAEVERIWAQRQFLGRPNEPIFYGDAHPDGDVDGDFHAPATATLEEAFAAYREQIAAADEVYAAASLDDVEQGGDRRHSLRWILVHLVEEYARHCGHADLIRQAIDGATGD
jgi:hypothetical protein